ncbi:MAG: SIS domain-containing protein [Streptococcaceae bacterium]|jgi:arabinose-5-phosphate isomerase|nr:SIS domain-containing protein [Streptococcaceae bacterium]
MNAENIVRRVINEEIAALQVVEARLVHNCTDYEKIINHILKMRGHLIFMGIGKTGHIGKKLAATFASTGTASFFVHAAEAMHGDLGMICPEDLVIIISNSGETKETLAPVSAIRQIGAKIAALTGNKNSSLAQASDFILEVFVEKEADQLNLAPTNSSTAALVVGDSLALTVSEMKRFRQADFARYHPGGALGQRLKVI